MQIQSARTRLYVTPVTTNVEHIDEGQGSDLFDVLLESLSPGTRGEGWSTFFPGVTDQTEPVILYWFSGLTRDQNGVPPLILLDSEWSLVQSIGNDWSRAEIGFVLRFEVW
jgi:hypothetical protein